MILWTTTRALARSLVIWPKNFRSGVRAVRNQRVVLDIRGAHEPVYVFRLLLVDYQIIEAKDIVLVANSAAIVGVYKLDHG